MHNIGRETVLGPTLYWFNVLTITACAFLALQYGYRHAYWVVVMWSAIGVFKVALWWAASAFVDTWERRHGKP